MNGFCNFIRITYETVIQCSIEMEEEIMKKLKVILTAALIFSVCSTAVSAIATAHCNHYVNTNGNGTCHNSGSGGCSRNYVDANGDGICDNAGSNGHCRNHVDANGDGICDNARYNIKYNLNGGKNNAKNPSCYCVATQTIKLQNPTKKGYTFKGWYADKQYKQKVTAIKKGSVGKKTLYAKWKKN